MCKVVWYWGSSCVVRTTPNYCTCTCTRVYCNCSPLCLHYVCDTIHYQLVVLSLIMYSFVFVVCVCVCVCVYVVLCNVRMCSWLCSPLRTLLCVCVCVFSLDSQISSFSACSMAKDEIAGISLYTWLKCFQKHYTYVTCRWCCFQLRRCTMVRGYHVYNAYIWASVVGEEFRKITNSHLVGGILLLLSEVGLLSSVALPTGLLSSQASGCRRVHWSLEGRS